MCAVITGRTERTVPVVVGDCAGAEFSATRTGSRLGPRQRIRNGVIQSAEGTGAATSESPLESRLQSLIERKTAGDQEGAIDVRSQPCKNGVIGQTEIADSRNKDV